MKNVLVSTFELLFARQIAKNPVDLTAPVNLVSRRVLQGYFLTIANLEDKQYRYRVHLQLTPATDPAGVPLFVTRVGNTISPPGFVSGSGGDYSLNITIPAKATGLVGVFPPNLAAPAPFDTSATEYQSRGYASISLPANIVLNRPFGVRRVAQSNKPVTVMVTPDLRATFLPNEFPTVSAGLDFDQTFASLPVASGNNVLTIDPTPGGKLVLGPMTSLADSVLLPERLERLGDFVADLSDEERSALFLSMLGNVDDSPESLDAFEGALAESKLPMALTRKDR